ncbi:MAG TPA: hypothetical protein VIX91_16070 [Candidatus Acidoferrum sp.]
MTETQRSSQAEAALLGLGRDTTLEGVRYRALLCQAERIGLLTLSRLCVRMERESPPHPGVRIVDTYFRMAGGVLRLISDSLLTGKLIKTAETPPAALEATTAELSESSASTTALFFPQYCGKRAIERRRSTDNCGQR